MSRYVEEAAVSANGKKHKTDQPGTRLLMFSSETESIKKGYPPKVAQTGTKERRRNRKHVQGPLWATLPFCGRASSASCCDRSLFPLPFFCFTCFGDALSRSPHCSDTHAAIKSRSHVVCIDGLKRRVQDLCCSRTQQSVERKEKKHTHKKKEGEKEKVKGVRLRQAGLGSSSDRAESREQRAESREQTR